MVVVSSARASLAINGLIVLGLLALAYRSTVNTQRNAELAAALVPSPATIGRSVVVDARKNQIASGRRCGLTGKHGTIAYKYCFSHKRATKRQNPNIQQKYVFWPDGQRMVRIKMSTSAMKTLDKKGLTTMAKEAGIDLNKLPFKDMRPERKEYVQKNAGTVPLSKKWVSGFHRKVHRMKNPEKLAASKKTPLEAKYYHGRIAFGRFSEEELRQLNDVPIDNPFEKAQYEEGLEVEDISAAEQA